MCAVVPSPWPPGPAHIDSEYGRFLGGMARAALERARERLPGDVAAASLIHHARSAPAGLLEVAERREAAMIVVGTSGQPAIGSVTARLLHGSPVPVALAPHGFRSRPGGRVERVTAAFGGSAGLVGAAGAVAAALGTPLRIASLAVPVHAPFAADLVERWARSSRRRRARRRPWWATGRAGRRRSTTSNGATATCSWLAPAPPLRPRGYSSAPARRGSSATHPCRSSSSHARTFDRLNTGPDVCRPAPPATSHERVRGRAAALASSGRSGSPVSCAGDASTRSRASCVETPGRSPRHTGASVSRAMGGTLGVCRSRRVHARRGPACERA